MGGMAGVLAGVATIGAGVALFRFVEKKARETRAAVDELQRVHKTATGHASGSGRVLDYQRDPADGVYRAK
ncbi:MAG: hypothetical protein AAF742_05905 [Pseudomonadota bacterium]